MALYSVGTRSCTYVNLGIGTLKVAAKWRKNSAENGVRGSVSNACEGAPNIESTRDSALSLVHNGPVRRSGRSG
jgi:hypothetical protein